MSPSVATGRAASFPNGATAAATVVVDELIRNRVCDLVLAPGSRSAALALAAADRPEMQTWVEIDERSASFFALGLSKAGRPSLVLTTSGTAAANLYPAVIEAEATMVPLLLLTADRPHELRATGANQTIDQVKLFGDAVRWFVEIPVAEDRPGEADYWRSVVCRSIAESRGWAGRPGPVHINMAFREPFVPRTHDGRATGRPYHSSTDGRDSGTPWVLHSTDPGIPRRFEARGRILVVAGDGADPVSVSEALNAGCVVIAEAHSGCRIAGTVTTAHHLLSSPKLALDLRPDTAVVLGRAGLSRNLSAFLATVDTVSVGRAWIDPDRRVTRIVQAASFVADAPDLEWQSTWERAELIARNALDSELDAMDAPSEPRAARDVAGAIPAGATLFVGSSMPVRDLDWFASVGPGNRVISNRGASGIDGSVSTALGAAAAAPAVAVLGDLALLHDQNGFLVAPRPDLVIVVINNDGGGIFSFLPQAALDGPFERLFGTPTGVDLSKLAGVYGLDYTLVEEATKLAGAVAEGLDGGGVRIIEIRTDRTENVALHRRLTDHVVAEVERLLES